MSSMMGRGLLKGRVFFSSMKALSEILPKPLVVLENPLPSNDGKANDGKEDGESVNNVPVEQKAANEGKEDGESVDDVIVKEKAKLVGKEDGESVGDVRAEEKAEPEGGKQEKKRVKKMNCRPILNCRYRPCKFAGGCQYSPSSSSKVVKSAFRWATNVATVAALSQIYLRGTEGVPMLDGETQEKLDTILKNTDEIKSKLDKTKQGLNVFWAAVKFVKDLFW